MCPGTYIPNEEVQAYIDRAKQFNIIDQQVRAVDVGKSNLAVGLVYRGKLDKPADMSVAEHDLVSELYHIIEGTGTLVLSPELVGAKRRPPESETVRMLNGPGQNAASVTNGVTYNLKPGDVVIIPAGTGHWFTKIDDHIVYLMVRLDPDKVTPPKTEADSKQYLAKPPARHDRRPARRQDRLEDRQVGLPGADGVGVLPRHDADDLADVAQVVRDPRRQVLPQRHDAEVRMPSAARHVGVGQPERVEPGEALGSQSIERVEQFAERPALRRREHRLAIERRERHRVAMPQDVLDARHPVVALAVNQMADDVERAPGVRPLHGVRPGRRKVGEQAAQDSRRPLEHRQRGVEPELHSPTPRRPDRRRPRDWWCSIPRGRRPSDT